MNQVQITDNKKNMNQTTNAILMIRPVAFRMNEQTAVNNYYQKVLDGLLPATVNAKAQQEFDAFVANGTNLAPTNEMCNVDEGDIRNKGNRLRKKCF